MEFIFSPGIFLILGYFHDGHAGEFDGMPSSPAMIDYYFFAIYGSRVFPRRRLFRFDKCVMRTRPGLFAGKLDGLSCQAMAGRAIITWLISHDGGASPSISILIEADDGAPCHDLFFLAPFFSPGRRATNAVDA